LSSDEGCDCGIFFDELIVMGWCSSGCDEGCELVDFRSCEVDVELFFG